MDRFRLLSIIATTNLILTVMIMLWVMTFNRVSNVVDSSFPSSVDLEGTLPVALVNLITSPEKYETFRIQVSGYLVNFESTLYLGVSKEAALFHDFPALVHIKFGQDAPMLIDDFRLQSCMGMFVTVVGRFERNPVGKFFEINSIEMIDALENVGDEIKSSVCYAVSVR